MEKFQTIVIGGGAAGLMAAITSARQGFRTLIFEKNKKFGRKILVTGNGRCNLTNTDISPGKYYGQNTKCLHSIFNRFSSNEAMEFFEQLGAQLKIEEAGRVFPVTNQASTVLDLLVEEMERLGIKVNLQESVKILAPFGDGWKVVTYRGEYQSKKVVLCVGGKSYPQLGATGDGYEMSRRLGHRIVEPRPALAPLELVGNWFHKLQGVKSEVELLLTAPDYVEQSAAVRQGKSIAKETGELLFTHYGISGPIVLNLSRLAGVSQSEFTINFFPGYDAEKLKGFLSGRWQAHPQKTLATSLVGLLPKKLCDVLSMELKLADNQVSQITKKELQFIVERLIRWPIEVRKPRGFDESMVTAGGVAMDEVNARTMESLKAKGLYLAGEILDIDGISGGYNLQFAWSTGYIAGLQGQTTDKHR